MSRAPGICAQICQGLAVDIVGAQHAGVELARQTLSDLAHGGAALGSPATHSTDD